MTLRKLSWYDTGAQRHQWVQTCHQIWAAIVSAGGSASDITPLDFNPFYEKPKPASITLEPGDWAALREGFVSQGVPVVKG